MDRNDFERIGDFAFALWTRNGSRIPAGEQWQPYRQRAVEKVATLARKHPEAGHVELMKLAVTALKRETLVFRDAAR